MTRNNYYSTTHWEGNRATATITFPAGDLPAGTYSVSGYDADSSFNEGNCLPSSYNFSWTPSLPMVVGQAKVASTTALVVSTTPPTSATQSPSPPP